MADPLSSDGVPSKLKSTDKETKQTEVAEHVDAPGTEQKEVKQDIMELEQDVRTQVTVTGSDPVITGQPPEAVVEEILHEPPNIQQNIPDQQELLSGVVTKDMIPDLPVFTSEEEKIAFEETLNQIDMTQVRNPYFETLKSWLDVTRFFVCLLS